MKQVKGKSELEFDEESFEDLERFGEVRGVSEEVNGDDNEEPDVDASDVHWIDIIFLPYMPSFRVLILIVSVVKSTMVRF